MAGALTFRVEAEAGDLTIGKMHFTVGEHTVAKPSANLAKCLASAEAAGGVTILKVSGPNLVPRGHIESDEDSLKVQEKNMSDVNERGEIVGVWQEGNIQDFIAQKKALAESGRKLLEREEVEGVVPEHLLEAALEGVEEPTDEERDSVARSLIESNIARLEQQVTQAEVKLAEVEG